MNDLIYYHFLSSRNAIYDLENRRIKISLLNSLNDPFELMPYLGEKDKEQKEVYYKIRNAVSKKYGLLCFSNCWDEPLLWGHYAEKHKGIALGFKIEKYDIIRVKYIRKRYELPLCNTSLVNKRAFLKLAERKYVSWQYEKEYRILVELKDCTFLNGDYFLPFEDNLILKEIVLGCKYENNPQPILRLSKQLGIKVIPSRMAFGSYKIVKAIKRMRRLKKDLKLIRL